ncbi:MAG: helix-turn-helix domain-containing protein [Bacteroides sp.]|nr:helix-turn-helix domain-containing protein [Eubacterium sp.]MCM1463756.1 helix-turn-helix domain-containing protein [Bacteroides sp.]
MSKNIISQNVKRIIEEKGLKQKSVAQKGGYKPQQFSNMLSGRKIIGGLDVLRIANALDVTPNDLFRSEPSK